MKKLLLLISLATCALPLWGQRIYGTITDTRGMPLPGANILVAGTSTGTTTEDDGSYRLTLPDTGTWDIVVSYVGYRPRSVRIRLGAEDQTKELSLELKEEATVLQTLTLKATRATSSAPFATNRLTRSDLETNYLAQDLPYLLDELPSVVVTSDAGTGIGYTGMRIRGSDATRVNVTINGVPLNDAESQGVFWVDLPDFASSLADVQVQRGIGSSTNGPGAFGATVNLNTALLEPNSYAEANLAFGSFDTRRQTFLFGTGLMPFHRSTSEGFSLDGRLSRISSDGYIDRARADLESFFVSGAFIRNRSSLRLNVFSGHEETYQAWNGVPAQWVNDEKLRRYNSAGTEKPGLPYEDEVDDYTQTHYQLHYDYRASKQTHIGLTGFYIRGKGFFEQYKADQTRSRYLLQDTLPDCCYDFVRRRWLDNHFYGALWSVDYTSLSKLVNLTFGGIASQYLGDHYGELYDGASLLPDQFGHRYYFSDAVKNDVTVFLKGRLDISPRLRAFAEAQFRRIHYETEGTNNDLYAFDVERNHHFFNPKAGLVYLPANGWRAYASFSVGHREPSRDDYINAPKPSDAVPEKLYDSELGIEYRAPDRSVGLNFYYMHYRDQLVLTGNINDVGEPIRQNVPTSYRMGVEFTGSYAPMPRLTLSANATLSRNKIENFTEYVDNWDTGEQEVIFHGTTDIAFSPRIVAFGKLRYHLLDRDKVEGFVNFGIKHVGQQFIDNTSNPHTTLPAYTVANLLLQVSVLTTHFEELTFKLQVNNLFDARYSSNAWTYRYISPSYDARPDDPYARLESGNTYNLTGFYPQAGRHFLVGMNVRL